MKIMGVHRKTCYPLKIRVRKKLHKRKNLSRVRGLIGFQSSLVGSSSLLPRPQRVGQRSLGPRRRLRLLPPPDAPARGLSPDR